MDPITENVGDNREAKFPVFQPEDQERELWGAKAQRKSGGGAGEKSKSVHAVLSILPSYNNGGSTAKALRIRLCGLPPRSPHLGPEQNKDVKN